MRRFTIMGFTEAELGFVLAALFIAVAVGAVHERDASAVTVQTQQASADSLRAAAEAARDSLIRLRENLAQLDDSLAALHDKISTKVPQCWERGEPSAPVADLAVLGANRFALGRDTLTIDGVTQRLAPFIERGTELGCRYIVRARPHRGIDAVQQSAAVWQLRRYFDVNDRPQ